MSDSRDSFTLSQKRISAEQWKEFDYEVMVYDLIDALTNGDEYHPKTYLHDYGDSNLTPEINNNHSLLHAASTHKQHGAIIDAVDTNGSSPLHIAVANRDSNSLKTLLEHGANPNLHNKAGYTPLHLAVKEGFEEIVSALLVNKDIDVKNKNTLNPSVSALTLATVTNRADIVSMLLAKGTDANELIDGIPILYFVIFMHDDINLVNAYLDGGADPTITTEQTEGVSPLVLALSKGNLEIVEKIATHKSIDPDKSVLIKKDILREFAKDHHLVATMNMVIASTAIDDKKQELCKLTHAEIVDIINVALMVKNTPPPISILKRLSMFNADKTSAAHASSHSPVPTRTTPR